MTSLPRTHRVETLIVGAGPTGLGAAIRLNQLGQNDFLLVDQNPKPGGLSSTVCTPEGFLFDLGGHVIFSHYQYFDDLLASAIDEWITHERISYVLFKDRWIPYPFQNNLSLLPVDDQVKCIRGAIKAAKLSSTSQKPLNFNEWMTYTMGDGIADVFLRPYNKKVWAYDPEIMSCTWLGERVAVVDAESAAEQIIRKTVNHSWGPNAVFKFPKKGGTGAIWSAVGEMIPMEKVAYGWKLQGLDVSERRARLRKVTSLDSAKDDQLVQEPEDMIINYTNLISSIPLDILFNLSDAPPLDLSGLIYSSTHIIGIGFRGSHELDKKCWLYFPEDTCPFYRCTVFSNYSDLNVPGPDVKLSTISRAGDYEGSSEGEPPREAMNEYDTVKQPGPYFSLMFEVAESPVKPVDSETIVQETIRGAIACNLIKFESEIVSIFHTRLERGYPTPTLGRDAALARALPWLESHGIFSRGRFGAWKYEVANQDHSLMQGVEAVDRILFGGAEKTLNDPDAVNKAKNMEPVFSRGG